MINAKLNGKKNIEAEKESCRLDGKDWNPGTERKTGRFHQKKGRGKKGKKSKKSQKNQKGRLEMVMTGEMDTHVREVKGNRGR